MTSTPRASPTGPRSSPGAEGHLGRGGGSPTNHPCPLTAGRTVLPSIIFLGLFSSSSQTQMGHHQTPLFYKHYIFPSLQPFTDFRRQNHSSSPDTLLYRSPDLKNCLLPIINQVSVSDQVCTWILMESVGHSPRHQQMLKASVYTHRNYKLILMF